MGNNDLELKLGLLGLSSGQKRVLVNLSEKERSELFKILGEEQKKKRIEDTEKYDRIEECRKKILDLLNESKKYIDDEKWGGWVKQFRSDDNIFIEKDFWILDSALKILRGLENGESPEEIKGKIIKELEEQRGDYQVFVHASRVVVSFSKYGKIWGEAAKKRDKKSYRKLGWKEKILNRLSGDT